MVGRLEVGLEGALARPWALEPSTALDEARLVPGQGLLPPTLRAGRWLAVEVPLLHPASLGVYRRASIHLEPLVAPSVVVTSGLVEVA